MNRRKNRRPARKDLISARKATTITHTGAWEIWARTPFIKRATARIGAMSDRLSGGEKAVAQALASPTLAVRTGVPALANPIRAGGPWGAARASGFSKSTI